jgi:hypothetical protein
MLTFYKDLVGPRFCREYLDRIKEWCGPSSHKAGQNRTRTFEMTFESSSWPSSSRASQAYNHQQARCVADPPQIMLIADI